jgi:transposase
MWCVSVDVADGMASLLVCLLLNHGQTIVHLPGLAVNRASAGYCGLGETDAKDARVRDLALELLGLHEKIHELDKLIDARFREDELTAVISTMPGLGPLLGAEFLAATGGDLSRFPGAVRLAAFSGVAPVPRDSGNVNGTLHRPRRYHRGLQRVFYRSAMISIRTCPDSRAFYDRERAEKSSG